MARQDCDQIILLCFALIISSILELQSQLKYLECNSASMQKQLEGAKTDLDDKISSELLILKSQGEMLMEKQAQVETVQSNLAATMQKNITAQVETVQSDLVAQSEVVKQLQSDVRSLVTALHEQTEMVAEQQGQMKESW